MQPATPRSAVLTVYAMLACLWAAPVAAQDRVFALSELAVMVGHAADLAETQRCLGAGRCREVNPWLARYESPTTFAAAKFGVAGLQLWAVRKLHRTHPKWAAVINYGVGAGFVALAARNARVGR